MSEEPATPLAAGLIATAPVAKRGARVTEGSDAIVSLWRRLSKTSFSLRVVIGLSFTAILLLSGGGLILLNQQGAARLVRQQIDQQFDILVSGVTSQVALQFDAADVVLDTLSVSPPAATDPEAMAGTLVRVLANLSTTSPAVLSIVTARGDGAYVLAQRMLRPRAVRDGVLREAPAVYSARVGTIAGGAALERTIGYDAEFAVVSREAAAPVAYDPRSRPWYEMALKTSAAITTPPYLFRDNRRFGFTMSRRTAADPTTIFGIDVRLDSLSETLKHGLVFAGEHVAIFAPDGALMGDSGGLRLDGSIAGGGGDRSGLRSPAYRIDAAAYAAYRQNRAGGDVTLDVDGQEFYANLAPFAINGTAMVIASAMPADLFDAPASRLLLWSLVLQGSVVLLAFCLVGVASRSIARPIRSLATDVEEIIRFRFATRARKPSRIREIQRLLVSVDTLELSLKAFSTYMPERFVRGIVDRGRIPELGGRRQRVIVMFSDIGGFTAIAEAMTPDELMPQLSRYFSEISDEVLASGGTVDKFVGDGVMAFWPVEDHDPERAAMVCGAVLNACRRLDALNSVFEAEGRPALPTRFGLHAGDAMVGSVGTPDRMNYTVMGHTVNVASRIEQLNKRYGTRVLASGALRDGAGVSVAFRPVDAAAIRGTQGAIEVFEVVEASAPGIHAAEAAATDHSGEGTSGM